SLLLVAGPPAAPPPTTTPPPAATAVIHGLVDASYLLATVDGYCREIADDLERIREAAVRASSGVLTDAERHPLNIEAQQLLDEVGRVIAQARFNQLPLLDAAADRTPTLGIVLDARQAAAGYALPALSLERLYPAPAMRRGALVATIEQALAT